MKERPILFSGPMVRAILEGRKTVTRRAIKPIMRSADLQFDLQQEEDGSWNPYHTFDESRFDRSGTEHPIKCPYGQPGDRLWVRESWWQAGDWQSSYPEDDEGSWFGSKRIVYSVDGLPPNESNHCYPSGLRNGHYSAAEPNRIWRHRPSIHMPRWASRILLEITDVRVERLQDISGDQAEAEGVDSAMCRQFLETSPSRHECKEAVIHGFAGLWASINGDESWNANPWVWVVKFNRVTP